MSKSTTITLYLIIIVLINSAFTCLAESKQTFVITHVDHPDIQFYNDILEKVYTELGFKVEFIPVPTKRGLILLNDGVVDADTIRLNATVKNYENILAITPAFENISLALVCKKQIPCQIDIFADEKSSILANNRSLYVIKPALKTPDIKANIVINNKINNTLNLIRADRYYYAILPVDPNFHQKLIKEFNVVIISSPSFSHVIHKKHKAMIPRIDKMIAQHLTRLTQERNLKGKR
ncbi:hypothetical protein [Pseudoalteromonas tetraodonis]|uniref:hypothetical protein n=1 Tax=Pseudoalteromonas tetraodonis TaxID=43659 RepID=UPI003A984DF8